MTKTSSLIPNRPKLGVNGLAKVKHKSSNIIKVAIRAPGSGPVLLAMTQFDMRIFPEANEKVKEAKKIEP